MPIVSSGSSQPKADMAALHIGRNPDSYGASKLNRSTFRKRTLGAATHFPFRANAAKACDEPILSDAAKRTNDFNVSKPVIGGSCGVGQIVGEECAYERTGGVLFLEAAMWGQMQLFLIPRTVS